MFFAGRRVANLTAADISGLVGVVGEGTGVDFKLEVGRNDEGKREFAADVSSFANTEGGYLLIGVDEEAGIASAIPGVQVDDLDAEIQRLDNIARSGVDPRLPAFEIGPVDVDGVTVLVARVGRSWSAPHMVTLNNMARFYRRNSAGKYPLDAGEIRQAFMRSIDGAGATRTFHAERVDLSVRNLLPGVNLRQGPKLIVHLVPVGSLEGGQSVDPTAVLADNRFRPMYSDYAASSRLTADGALAIDAPNGNAESFRYLLLYRNGIVEAVDAALLEFRPGEVLGWPFERTIVDDVTRFLEIQRDLNVEPPVILLMTLSGLDGWRIVLPDDPIPPAGGWLTIDRSPIALPEAVIDAFDADLPRLLHPTFDAFWQSGGFLRSPFYDAEGVWSRRD